MTSKKNTSSRKKNTVSTRRKKSEPLAFVEMGGASVAHGHSAHDESRAHEHLREKNRRLIMWIGVSVIMTAIVIGWILNLKQIMGPDAFSLTPKDSQIQVDFEDLKKGLRETMDEVKTGVQNLETIAPTSSAAPATTPIVSPTESAQPNTLPN